MALEQDLVEAIDKNLTSEVSNRLQERLMEAEVSIKKNKSLEKQVETLTKKLARAEDDLGNRDVLKKKEKELVERAEGLRLAEEQLQQTLAINNVVLESTENRRQDTWKMLELLLANRTFRETAIKNVILKGGESPNYCGDSGFATSSGDFTQAVTDTKETEEK